DCNTLKRFKVKHQWQQVFSGEHHRTEFSLHFWKEFLHDHPDLVSLFKRVQGENIYSPEFQAHGIRVLAGLDSVIGVLDEDDTFTVQLAHLKAQHTERGTKPEYFDLFGTQLFDILGDKLGTHFDQAAWRDCYAVIAAGIKP
uniref:Extracellular globin-1 n=1 Tax=Metaphire sieboldi TaxID=506672 RepID=GLB1_METSO|nr:RecName: Full=Extracellular globin-1; AltName: Full=Erythrocruorin; AltName: Full=Globin I [Metaphire sieboldi]